MKVHPIRLKNYCELIQMQKHYLTILNEVSPTARGIVREYIQRLNREIEARRESKKPRSGVL
ncbi:hypothetical protein [Hydrococcus rivularis]|uniref:hypothetical protein n=1 Tax=Hydrococcus rivularis TaxID=1616834 RepID=UPI000B1FE710|nr:hypothetical protein [Hydrococcus rivularis]